MRNHLLVGLLFGGLAQCGSSGSTGTVDAGTVDTGTASLDVSGNQDVARTEDTGPAPGDVTDAGGSGVSSCTQTMGGGLVLCTNWTGAMGHSFATAFCSSMNDGAAGTVTDATCPSAGLVGTCRITMSGMEVVAFIYSVTTATAQMQCTNNGGTFAPP